MTTENRLGPSSCQVPNMMGVFLTQVLKVVPYAEVEVILDEMDRQVIQCIEDQTVTPPVVSPVPMAQLAQEINGRLQAMSEALNTIIADKPAILAADGDPA